MSLRKYQAFLKTVETGSITQAAADLGYTQSAISKMIADLEEEWDVSLLTRGHTGIVLTGEGQSLLPNIQDVVRGYDNLNLAVSELHGMQAGTLRIGCFTSLSTSILPQILKSFHEKYPNIQIRLLNGEYYEISDWLKRGSIDCGFLSMRAVGDFDTTFIFRDSLVAILPSDHPMANAPCFPLEQIREETFLNLREEQDREIIRFFEKNNIAPKIAYSVTSDFALLSMVENGLGISIVHDLILHPPRHNIVRIPLNITQFRDIVIATRKSFVPSILTRTFIEFVVSSMRNVPLSSYEV